MTSLPETLKTTLDKMKTDHYWQTYRRDAAKVIQQFIAEIAPQVDAMQARIAELEAAVSLANKALDALGDSNGELQDRITVLEVELAQGNAEPETVDVSELREIAQTWQPIPDGETIGLDVGDTTLTVDCAYLWTRDDKQSVALPDDVRLCRLTESPPTWQPISDRIRLAHKAADYKLSLYADTVFYGEAEFLLPDGYAVCRLTSTPTSEAAPPVPEPVEGWTPPAEWWKPWVKAIAVDANGNIYGYGTKPVVHSNFKMWTSRGEGEQMLISAIDMTDKPADWWKSAIWLRPEGV